MKKVILLLLTAAMLVCLAGCGNKQPEQVAEKLTTLPDPKADERAEKGLGHFVEYLDRKGKVVDVRYFTSAREVSLRAGYGEAAVNVTITLGYPKTAPFSELKTLCIGDYQLIDDREQVLLTGTQTDAVDLKDGTVTLSVPIPNGQELDIGIYHLKVDNLIGTREEADPVRLVGPWDFTFAID